MEIIYLNRHMEKTLTSERLLQKMYGVDSARLSNRLSELRAAVCLEMIPNVPPPRRHKLSGNYAGCWGIDFSANRRLVIEPVGDYTIDDLTTISKIRILALEDYH